MPAAVRRVFGTSRIRPTPVRWSPRARTIAGVVGLVVGAAACSGGGSGGEGAGGSQVVTAPSPSTTDATTSMPTTAPVTEAPTTTVEPTTTVAPTTTTTEPLVTEGAVVLVANAAALPGAAAQMSRQLAGLGFTLAEPTNAAGQDSRLDATKVYVLPEGAAVGRSVARLLGDVPVEAMPTPAWIVGATAALGEATVLVMLGADLAEFGVPPR